MHHVKRLRISGALQTVALSSSSSSSLAVAARVPKVKGESSRANAKAALVNVQMERLRLEEQHLQAERDHLKAVEALLDEQAEYERSLNVASDPREDGPSQPTAKTSVDASTAVAAPMPSSPKAIPMHAHRYLTLFFDGASKKNPGEAGAGWILSDAKSGASIAYGWKYLGDRSTNNEAEYTGLIEGLQYINKSIRDVGKVEVKGDSNLVVQQVLGNWKCNAANLAPYCDKAKSILKSLKRKGHISLAHVPREDNAIADVISNLAVKLRTAETFENLETKVDVNYLKTRFGV